MKRLLFISVLCLLFSVARLVAQPGPTAATVPLTVNKATGVIQGPVDASTFAGANGLGGGGGGGGTWGSITGTLSNQTDLNTALGLKAAKGANSDITSLTAITSIASSGSNSLTVTSGNGVGAGLTITGGIPGSAGRVVMNYTFNPMAVSSGGTPINFNAAPGITFFRSDKYSGARGAYEVYDGTSLVNLVGVLSTSTPSAGQVPVYQSNGTVIWAAKVDANGAITGATKTKITYDAKGLVTSGADATTADIPDSTNKRYITDAQLASLASLTGTNTGDQNLFGSVVVSGQPTITATANPTALTLVAGAGVQLTTDNTAKSVTLATTDPVTTGITGPNVQRVSLTANQWNTVYETTGSAGVLKHWWLAMQNADITTTLVRMTANGASTPQFGGSAGIPIIDVFGTVTNGGIRYRTNRIGVVVADESRIGGYFRFPMPFTTGFKIEIYPLSTSTLWMICEVSSGKSNTGQLLAAQNWVLHATQTSASVANLAEQDLVNYSGTVALLGGQFRWNPSSTSTNSWQEGDFKIYYNGSGTVSYRSSGTEDFFSSAYNFLEGAFANDNFGMLVYNSTGNQRLDCYRFFDLDAMPRGTSSLRFTWTNGDSDYNPPGFAVSITATVFFYVLE